MKTRSDLPFPLRRALLAAAAAAPWLAGCVATMPGAVARRTGDALMMPGVREGGWQGNAAQAMRLYRAALEGRLARDHGGVAYAVADTRAKFLAVKQKWHQQTAKI
ncbi:MAG: hypothetical protein N2690_10825 [Rhodocyclaceae bacterium]|nr:hypothetical protein [Rhodocyclaceae bacterium]